MENKNRQGQQQGQSNLNDEMDQNQSSVQQPRRDEQTGSNAGQSKPATSQGQSPSQGQRSTTQNR